MSDVAGAALLDASLLVGDLPVALAQLATSVGGDGTLLIRTRNSISRAIVSSASIEAPVEAYMRGDRPVDPRAARVNPSLDEGFRLDHDDFSAREIARDPYYQEFLRPIGLGWHACALLARLGNGDEIHLAIKRQIGRGAFTQGDLAPLTRQLPLLRAAVAFTGLLLREDAAEATLQGAGRTIIGFGPKGEAFVIARAAGDEAVLDIRGGALTLVNGAGQAALAKTVADAIGQAQPGAMLLRGPGGRRYAFRLTPWPGAGQAAVTFVGALTALDSSAALPPEWGDAVRALFGFSAGEARVAALVAQGVAVTDIAGRLDLSAGTVRNHLKADFAKTGVTRQIELAVMLARI